MARFCFILILLLCALTVASWKLWFGRPVDDASVSPILPSTSGRAAGHAETDGMSADEARVTNAPIKPSPAETRRRPKAPKIPLTDVTAESGLLFVHHRGHSAGYLLPETMGSGCAVLDLQQR